MELYQRMEQYALTIVRTCMAEPADAGEDSDATADAVADIVGEVMDTHGAPGLVLLVTALGRHGGMAYTVTAQGQGVSTGELIDRMAVNGIQ